MTSISLADAPDVWDDSALIKSWDQAVEEYNKYHSIHARGEKVEDVLDRARAGDFTLPGMIMVDGEDIQTEQDTALVDENQEQPEAQKGSNDTAHKHTRLSPKDLLRSDQNPALQNLLMSWYYAGYYSGIYEQQEQGQGTDSTPSNVQPSS